MIFKLFFLLLSDEYSSIFRVVLCDYCSALIRSSDLHDHISTCEAFQSMVQKHKEKDHISFSYAKLVNCEFVIKKGS